MKGIYLTEEGKQEIEAKIANLKGYNDEPEITQLKIYKEILASAIILPVEESWGYVPMGTNECELVLPSGVIIRSKNKLT